MDSKKLWQYFISGAGLNKLINSIEQMKVEMRGLLKHQGKRERYLILSIRMEHLQIKKHQKIALKYLEELERKVGEYYFKEQRRTNFKETYKVK